ncbi:hypothetical protein D3C79_841190 [compost metagenome]
MFGALGMGGLKHRAAQVHHYQCADRTDEERNPPAPGLELLDWQHILQHHHRQQREQLAGDDGEVLERAKEAALALAGNFADVGGPGAVFSTDREPLHQAGYQQQHRSCHADGLISGQYGDHQRAATHQEHRDDHGELATTGVGQVAENPPA